MARGGLRVNWTRDIFPGLSNFSEGHRATSVGHDLIGHYQNYLYDYEAGRKRGGRGMGDLRGHMRLHLLSIRAHRHAS